LDNIMHHPPYQASKVSEEMSSKTKRTNLPPLNPFSQSNDLARTLMSQTQFASDLRAPNASVFPEVHVAAADAGGGDVDQAFSGGGRWGGDFDDGELVRGVGCDGDVGLFEGCAGGHFGGDLVVVCWWVVEFDADEDCVGFERWFELSGLEGVLM
jgi:hypothetical protein